MKYVHALICAIIILILQMFLAPCISFAGIGPDFIIIFIAVIGCYFGKTTVPMVAVLLGCALDLTTNGNIFINTVSYIICALGISVFKLFTDEIELPFYIIIIVASVLIKGVVTVCGLYILELTEGISFVLFLKSLPSALYTVILAIPLYYFFKWLMNIRVKRNNDNTIPL